MYDIYVSVVRCMRIHHECLRICQECMLIYHQCMRIYHECVRIVNVCICIMNLCVYIMKYIHKSCLLCMSRVSQMAMKRLLSQMEAPPTPPPDFSRAGPLLYI